MLSRIFLFCFLLASLSATSQNKVLQFGPFNAGFYIDVESSCFGTEPLNAIQKDEGYYFVGQDAQALDVIEKIELKSSCVGAFEIFQRTTFAYGVYFEGEMAFFYRDWNVSDTKRSESGTMFCTDWSKVELKDGSFQLNTADPRWPDESFLESCPSQGKVTNEQLKENLILPLDRDFYSKITDDYTPMSEEDIEKMINSSSVKVLKRAVEVQIRYTENGKAKTITVVFYAKWGTC